MQPHLTATFVALCTRAFTLRQTEAPALHFGTRQGACRRLAIEASTCCRPKKPDPARLTHTKELIDQGKSQNEVERLLKVDPTPSLCCTLSSD